ncbi:Phosphatidylinositol N-acetylglucosaminyltransferase [Abeliophyllum distichum]|uniref:Phosphatidylinositol N-acetylglucosaminyltransferase n=1 Tax=Abeliophyllum distichum TaxID=126358 RepID=A0ABD1RQU7_9LAMI
MDEPCSVNSPRRVLSFSKNRRANVSFPDPENRASSSLGIGVSGEHGPKPSEVYGFVGSITAVVATDEFSREQLSGIPSTDGDEQPIEPISDIGIDQINGIMFET